MEALRCRRVGCNGIGAGGSRQSALLGLDPCAQCWPMGGLGWGWGCMENTVLVFLRCSWELSALLPLQAVGRGNLQMTNIPDSKYFSHPHLSTSR